jgi:putative lipoic acid-binding regulatory protein
MCSSSKPLIEFPCEYPIKSIGDGSSVFTDHIESVMTNTVGLGNYSKISEKYSKNKKWLSITISFIAKNENQLRRIHHHLKVSNSVKMVI